MKILPNIRKKRDEEYTGCWGSGFREKRRRLS